MLGMQLGIYNNQLYMIYDIWVFSIEDVGPRGAPAPQVASQASTGAFTALSSKADAAVASAKPGYDVSKCHHPSFHGFVS